MPALRQPRRGDQPQPSAHNQFDKSAIPLPPSVARKESPPRFLRPTSSPRFRRQKIPTNDTDDIKLNINVESSYDDNGDGDVQEEVPSNDTTLVSNETESELLVNETGPLMVLMPKQYMSMTSSGNNQEPKSSVSAGWSSVLTGIASSLSASIGSLTSTIKWPITSVTISPVEHLPISSGLSRRTKQSSIIPSTVLPPVIMSSLRTTIVATPPLPILTSTEPSIQPLALTDMTSMPIREPVAPSSFIVIPSVATTTSPLRASTTATMKTAATTAATTTIESSTTTNIIATSTLATSSFLTTTLLPSLPHSDQVQAEVRTLLRTSLPSLPITNEIASPVREIIPSVFASKTEIPIPTLLTGSPLQHSVSIQVVVDTNDLTTMELIAPVIVPTPTINPINVLPGGTSSLFASPSLHSQAPVIVPDEHVIEQNAQKKNEIIQPAEHTEQSPTEMTIPSTTPSESEARLHLQNAPIFGTISTFLKPENIQYPAPKSNFRDISLTEIRPSSFQLKLEASQATAMQSATLLPVRSTYSATKVITSVLLSTPSYNQRAIVTALVPNSSGNEVSGLPRTPVKVSVSTVAIIGASIQPTPSKSADAMTAKSSVTLPADEVTKVSTDNLRELENSNPAIGAMVSKVEDLVVNTTTAAKSFANITTLVNKLEGLVDNEVSKNSDNTETRKINEIVTKENNVTDQRYEGVITRLNYLTNLIEKLEEGRKHEESDEGGANSVSEATKIETVKRLNRIVSKLKIGQPEVSPAPSLPLKLNADSASVFRLVYHSSLISKPKTAEYLEPVRLPVAQMQSTRIPLKTEASIDTKLSQKAPAIYPPTPALVVSTIFTSTGIASTVDNHSQLSLSSAITVSSEPRANIVNSVQPNLSTPMAGKPKSAYDSVNRIILSVVTKESSKFVTPSLQSSLQHAESFTQHPTTNIQHPTTNTQDPATSNQHPTTSNQHPTATSQKATTNTQHPITSNHHSNATTNSATITPKHPSNTLMSEKFQDIARSCKASLAYYPGYSLRGGFSSGLFSHHSDIKTLAKCTQKCCSTDSCTVVFMLQGSCFTVRCTNKWLCAKVRNKSKSVKTALVYVRRGGNSVAVSHAISIVHDDVESSKDKNSSLPNLTARVNRTTTASMTSTGGTTNLPNKCLASPEHLLL